jgi:hypothetical protein
VSRTPLAAGLLAAALPLSLLLGACSGSDSEPRADPPASTTASTTASASPSPSATPTPAHAVPGPRSRACYGYGYAAAVAPVTHGDPVPCDSLHTAITFSVGELDTVVDGHLVSVDSDRVQQQVAGVCPRAFDAFVGGTPEVRRLTMLRPIWFTPSVKESDAGANWYRCDAVALAADEVLAPLTGRLQGVLARPLAGAAYAMCGTAEPGTDGFARVICSAPHAWKAIATVDVTGGKYPGVDAARQAGQQRCQDAASAVADDPLNYRWGYEWPTQQQWEGGQRWGFCWAPD